jgi:fructose-specific phosphotransferase system IIC component
MIRLHLSHAVNEVQLMFSGRVIFYRSILGTILMFCMVFTTLGPITKLMVVSGQQWTGTNSINYYAPQIFGQLGITGATFLSRARCLFQHPVCQARVQASWLLALYVPTQS